MGRTVPRAADSMSAAEEEGCWLPPYLGGGVALVPARVYLAGVSLCMPLLATVHSMGVERNKHVSGAED